MGRRQAPDVGKASRGRLLTDAEQQEIADGQVVQPVRDRRMKSDTIQGVAEDQAVREPRVVERLDPEMVAGTEQAALPPVPDGEGEVTEQILDALLAPNMVGVQEQFGVGGVCKSVAPP